MAVKELDLGIGNGVALGDDGLSLVDDQGVDRLHRLVPGSFRVLLVDQPVGLDAFLQDDREDDVPKVRLDFRIVSAEVLQHAVDEDGFLLLEDFDVVPVHVQLGGQGQGHVIHHLVKIGSAGAHQDADALPVDGHLVHQVKGGVLDLVHGKEIPAGLPAEPEAFAVWRGARQTPTPGNS